jgi:hypothetical protein
MLSLGGVERLVVACPKDLAMFSDAVITLGCEDRLVVSNLHWSRRAFGPP